MYRCNALNYRTGLERNVITGSGDQTERTVSNAWTWDRGG